MDELCGRGLRVPQDVAITGFHDGLEARITTPPLTTVRMPWRAAGQQAAERLLDLMAGRAFLDPDRPIMIPLEVIVRQSCGCPDARTTRAAAHSRGGFSPDRIRGFSRSLEPTTRPAEASNPGYGPEDVGTAQAMAYAVGPHAEGLEPGWADALLDAFLADLAAGTSGAPTAFLSRLNALLRQAGVAGANLNAWHDALSAMRRGLLPLLDGEIPDAAGAQNGAMRSSDFSRPTARPTTEVVTPGVLIARSRRAEDLWQQARVVIGQAAARGEAHQVWRLVGQAEALHQIEAALHVATDRRGLLAALAELLLRLGIRRCLLALYDDPAQPKGDARLIFALENGIPRPLSAAGLPVRVHRVAAPRLLAVPRTLQPGDRSAALRG